MFRVGTGQGPLLLGGEDTVDKALSTSLAGPCCSAKLEVAAAQYPGSFSRERITRA